MNITPVDLRNKKQVDDFLRLPFSIYRDIPQWVPPLQRDERLRLDPKRFPFYRHSQALFLLAYEGVQPIGGLAVLDNRRHNEYNKTNTAFFYWLSRFWRENPNHEVSQRYTKDFWLFSCVTRCLLCGRKWDSHLKR